MNIHAYVRNNLLADSDPTGLDRPSPGFNQHRAKIIIRRETGRQVENRSDVFVIDPLRFQTLILLSNRGTYCL